MRSPFGTRVARPIVCDACGAEDTLHFVPRPGQRVLCRRCAADQLGVIHPDSGIRAESRVRCERCELYVERPCQHEDPLDCPEHARALVLRQKGRVKAADRGPKGAVLRVRRPQEP